MNIGKSKKATTDLPTIGVIGRELLFSTKDGRREKT